MHIVYAAEKPSIAQLLGSYTSERIRPEDIDLRENPNETGSFYIGWHRRRFVLSPSGEIVSLMPAQHPSRAGR